MSQPKRTQSDFADANANATMQESGQPDATPTTSDLYSHWHVDRLREETQLRGIDVREGAEAREFAEALRADDAAKGAEPHSTNP